MSSANMSHGSDLIPPVPMRFLFRKITRAIFQSPGFYPLERSAMGTRFLISQQDHRWTPLSSLGRVPTNPHPPFPRNFHLLHTRQYRCVTRRTSRWYRKSMALRIGFQVFLDPPSLFSHPSISEPYPVPFEYHYRSSRRSTCRFPVFPGMI